MEEYAREVFPLEEAANGLTWMHEGNLTDGEEGVIQGGEYFDDADADGEDDDGLMMGGGIGSGPGTGGENTPARREESWLA